MRRITLWMLSTLSVLVLLFSYRTSTSSTAAVKTVAEAPVNGAGSSSSASDSSTSDSSTPSDSSTSSATPSTGSASSSSSSSSSTPSSSSSSSSSSSTSSAAKTYTGDVVSTRWGNVQVQITVVDGKVTKSVVTQVPWDNPRDQEINSYAVPVYNKDAVAKQSAQIDVVSGATVTWEGYTQSLQSALDQANL